MLIVTMSRARRHFNLIDARSRSQLHMAGAFITFNDCLVSSSSRTQNQYLRHNQTCLYQRSKCKTFVNIHWYAVDDVCVNTCKYNQVKFVLSLLILDTLNYKS